MQGPTQPADRIAELWPKYLRWAKRFGSALLLVALAIAVTSGNKPVLALGRSGRLVVVVVGYASMVGFAFYGGMTLFFWLLQRRGDPRR